MNRAALLFAAAVLVFNAGPVPVPQAAASNESADDIVGVYWNEDHDGQLRIYEHGDKYFGRITWREDDVLDENNPDPDLRSRHVVGIVFMRGFTFDGSGSWKGGTVYSFRNGKTYRGKMRVDGDQLVMRGYVGVPMLGKTARLDRVAPDEVREAGS